MTWINLRILSMETRTLPTRVENEHTKPGENTTLLLVSLTNCGTAQKRGECRAFYRSRRIHCKEWYAGLGW